MKTILRATFLRATPAGACVACVPPRGGAQQKEGVPPPSPTPQQQEAAPAKRNARPAAEPGAKPEPFDKATAEQMSKQCVTLSTEEGEIEIEMLPEVAPESVRNFLNLAATGAYDTTVFSRVVKGFIIQEIGRA